MVGAAELGIQAEALLAAHPDKAAQVRAGKHGLLGFFVGQLMKATNGKANPSLSTELMKKLLATA